MLEARPIINAPPALPKDQKSCSLGIYMDIHMSDLSQKRKISKYPSFPSAIFLSRNAHTYFS